MAGDRADGQVNIGVHRERHVNLAVGIRKGAHLWPATGSSRDPRPMVTLLGMSGVLETRGSHKTNFEMTWGGVSLGQQKF